MRRCSCFALVLLGLYAAAARADDWPVARGPSHEPKPYTYDAKSLRDVPKDFLDDAPACTLFTRTSHLVEADGTVEAITHEITRFNGRKGIEKLGEYRSIYFNPRYEKLTLHTARVLKADGSAVPVEPRHVQLRDVATDFQVYDDDKQLVISWPNLQVGDAYEVKWTVRSKNPEFAGQFFTRYTFGDDEHPVVRDELYVRVPAGKKLQYAAVNHPIDLTKTEADGQTHYHWKVRHKSPLPRDDDRPSKEEMRWQVACSTFPSWDAVGQWKQKGGVECWKCTDVIKAVVAKVAGPEKTPGAKTRALTHWVRHNIRYLSRGPEGMGFTPHPPAAVLGNRFGDCKDQAQLLAVMLREVGVPVWLATLGTLDDGQVLPDVPSPWGTHAILLVELDGQAHWIDTTVTQAPWDFLPRGDCGRLAYLMRDGKVKLVRTPAFTAKDYRIEQTTRLTVAADGTAHGKRTARYYGTSAWTKRDAWIDVPAGERRRLAMAELQDAHTRARLVALKVDEASLRDFDAPVQAELEYTVPDYFTGTPREGVLSDSAVWSRLLSITLDPTREVPFDLHTPFESTHRFIVELPASLRAGAPEEKKVESAWGSFTVKVHTDPADAHRLEITIHTRLDKTRVAQTDFAAYQAFHDAVLKAYRVWLTLRPTRDLADAPALEKLLTATPAEASAAQVLARLYLDHGKRADAQRVLAAAVKHSPKEQALWELRLQAATEAEKEPLYRAMIAQFPGEGQYAAALAANLVDRKQYAAARVVLLPLVEHETPAVRGAAEFQLARTSYHQRRFAEALKHLQAASEADSAVLMDGKALALKARVHRALGEVKEAIGTYRLGAALDPKAHALLDPLVRLEWQADQKTDALDHLRRFTVAVGDDPAGLVQAADLHLLLGRPDDALDLGQRVPADQRTAAAHRVLGLAHLRRKEYQAAADALTYADISASDDLIAAYVALGDLDAARRIPPPVFPVEIHRQVELLGRDRDALLARLAPAKADRDKAARAVDRFICAEHGLTEGWPREHVTKLVRASLAEMELAPALALRGWLALEHGQLGKALADADRAIALKPADARAFLVRGRVRLERGDARALDDLEEAARLSKRQDATVLHWLAAAQVEAGQVQLALETQERAVALRPGDRELTEQLRHLRAMAR